MRSRIISRRCSSRRGHHDAVTELAPIDRDGAIAEAVGIARGLGLRVDDPEILNARHNLVLWMRPAPVVARVTWITSLVRVADRAAQSVGLATFLHGSGVPVTPPTDAVDPGPHLTRSGCTVTLWQRLEIVDEALDPVAVGRGLRRVHEVARRYAGPMTSLDPIGEAAAVARIAEPFAPSESARLLRVSERLAMPDLPTQPVHGDAGLHNVLVTKAGWVWGDWEECGTGPVAWDLATLTHRARVLGERVEEIAAAERAYGPIEPGALEAVEPVFVAWAVAWGLLARIRDDRPVGDLVRARLAWLEARIERVG
jgi:Phosphotransferase enzyme family